MRQRKNMLPCRDCDLSDKLSGFYCAKLWVFLAFHVTPPLKPSIVSQDAAPAYFCFITCFSTFRPSWISFSSLKGTIFPKSICLCFWLSVCLLASWHLYLLSGKHFSNDNMSFSSSWSHINATSSKNKSAPLVIYFQGALYLSASIWRMQILWGQGLLPFYHQRRQPLAQGRYPLSIC